MSLNIAHRILPNGLRTVWVLVVLWLELGTFRFALLDCHWPDTRQPHIPDSRVVRILVIADPQIIDQHSYPGRGRLLSVLSQYIVDLNLRKNWNSAFRQLRPDALVVLGDMMDNGRLAMSDTEYEAYYARYQSIFNTGDSPLPVFYLPGNHDVGLGDFPSFSIEVGERYVSHFGPRNHRHTIGNHTLVFIDATSLIEEDVLRAERRHTFENWIPVSGGPVEFVKKTASIRSDVPLILFTHVPLARPLNATCGPLREKGSIRQGHGFGYQNTLMDGATEFLLEYLKPSLIMSGDDHDYCEYEHTIPSSHEKVQEITVKSLSMAMGIRRPGFQLLSLTSTVPSLDRITQIPVSPPLHTPCTLPDQLGIYLNVYIPLAALSLIALFISNVGRVRGGMMHQTWNKKHSRRDTTDILLSHSYHNIDGDESPAHESRDPHISPRGRTYSSPWTWAFTFQGQRHRFRLPKVCEDWFSRTDHPISQRKSGVMAGFFQDVFAVAWPPVCVFLMAAWWVMHW